MEQATDQPKTEHPKTTQADPDIEAEKNSLASESAGETLSPTLDTTRKPSIPVEPDSPEVRKTRRAKAKAAYAPVRTFAEDGASAALDVQA